MDNHERRTRYLPGRDLAAAYAAGTADDLLTPVQRRRVRHKRGHAGSDGHATAPRPARPESLLSASGAASVIAELNKRLKAGPSAR